MHNMVTTLILFTFSLSPIQPSTIAFLSFCFCDFFSCKKFSWRCKKKQKMFQRTFVRCCLLISCVTSDVEVLPHSDGHQLRPKVGKINPKKSKICAIFSFFSLISFFFCFLITLRNSHLYTGNCVAQPIFLLVSPEFFTLVKFYRRPADFYHFSSVIARRTEKN